MICESFAYEHEATRLFEFEISFQTYFAKVCEPRPSLFSIYDIKFALNVRIQNHDRNCNLNNILRLSQCLLKLILQAPSKKIFGHPPPTRTEHPNLNHLHSCIKGRDFVARECGVFAAFVSFTFLLPKRSFQPNKQDS